MNNKALLTIIIIILLGIFAGVVMQVTKKSPAEQIANDISDVTEQIGDEIDDRTTQGR